MPRVLNELHEEDFESLVYHTKAIVKNFEKKYDKEMVRMAFETALNEAKKKNESEQRVDTIQGFADSLDLTRDHIGLIMDELNTDDADETFPVKELGGAMQRAKAKIGEDAWYMMFDDDPIYEGKSLKEGENVLNENGLGGSEFVDDELDMFLEDIAQMFGTIDYTEAIEFEKSITSGVDIKLKKLLGLYRDWTEAGELEDEDELENIAVAVAKLVKGSWKPVKESEEKSELNEDLGFNVKGKLMKDYEDARDGFINALADVIPETFPGYSAEYESDRLYLYGPGINPKARSTGFGDELLPEDLYEFIKKEAADAGLEIGGFLGVGDENSKKPWVSGAISLDFQTAGYSKKAQAFYDGLSYKGD